MNACDREKLLLLAAGELPAGEANVVERHAAGCADCAAELAALREGLGALARLPAMVPSGAAIERIGQAADEQLDRRRIVRPHFVWRYRYALATAAALAILIGWAAVQQMFAPPMETPRNELAGLWDKPQTQVTESATLADDLANWHADDPWTAATETVIAQMDERDVTGELLDLENNLELLEGSVGEGT